MHFPQAKTSRRNFLAASAGVAVTAALPNPSGGFPFPSAAEEVSGARALPGKPQRIILDTDPGVDDAIAIFLALRSPELHVEAVTPVSGNVPLSFTLPNALRVLEIAGEISIVAIGPLTNSATVLKVDPAIAPMIKSFVLMGGCLTGGNITPAAEFNFYVDPEAARIVFDSGVPITMVGLDVTNKVLLHESQVRILEAAQNPISQAAGKIMRATMSRIKPTNDETVVAMHDPLTIASLIDPSVVTLKDYYVQIETTGEMTAGMSVGYYRGPVRRSPPMETGANGPIPTEEYKPNCKVAVGVDPDKFFRLLLPRLTQSS